MQPTVNQTTAFENALSSNTGSQQVANKEDSASIKDKPARSKSSLVSRNITIAGHRTSVRLEPEMWNGLSEICQRECASIHEVCTVISSHKPQGSSLTAAIRVFVMAYFRAAATEEGHSRSGHGPGGHMMMTMLIRKEANKK